jgi:hypothetical protein
LNGWDWGAIKLPWLRPKPLNPFNPWLIFILAVVSGEKVFDCQPVAGEIPIIDLAQ